MIEVLSTRSTHREPRVARRGGLQPKKHKLRVQGFTFKAGDAARATQRASRRVKCSQHVREASADVGWRTGVRGGPGWDWERSVEPSCSLKPSSQVCETK